MVWSCIFEIGSCFGILCRRMKLDSVYGLHAGDWAEWQIEPVEIFMAPRRIGNSWWELYDYVKTACGFWRKEFPQQLSYGIYHNPYQQPNVCDLWTYSLAPGPHSNHDICGMMINEMGSLTRKRNTARNSTFVRNNGDDDLTVVTIKRLLSTKDVPAVF